MDPSLLGCLAIQQMLLAKILCLPVLKTVLNYYLRLAIYPMFRQTQLVGVIFMGDIDVSNFT